MPLTKDFRGCTWNAQALFAAKATRHFPKLRYAARLLKQHDWLCLQETHSTSGKCDAVRLPDSCKAYWSHGTRSQAGVGILVSRTFLENFDENLTHFESIQDGRIAVLRLNGPSGSLDIWVVYLDACSHQERLHSLRRIAESYQGQHSTLSVLAGDWNFVTTLKDRCCSTPG